MEEGRFQSGLAEDYGTLVPLCFHSSLAICCMVLLHYTVWNTVPPHHRSKATRATDHGLEPSKTESLNTFVLIYFFPDSHESGGFRGAKGNAKSHPEVWAEQHPILRATSQLHSKDKRQAATRGFGKDPRLITQLLYSCPTSLSRGPTTILRRFGWNPGTYGHKKHQGS